MNTERNKNREFVAIDHKLDCSWKFVIASTARMTSDVYDEILSITRAIFESIDEFVVPIQAEVAIGELPNDESLDELFDRDSDYTPDISRERLEAGGKEQLTFCFLEEALSDVVADMQNTTFVSEIDLTNAKTKFRLETGDEYIDRSSDEAVSWSQEKLTASPSLDPLHIRIRLSPPYRDFEEAEFYYTVVVSTATDIWFEETTIGRTNRNRLTAMLQTIYEQVDTIEVEYDSNRYPKSELRERGYAGLLFD